MFVIVLVLLIVGTVTPSTAITPADTRDMVVSVACPIFTPVNCGLSLVQSPMRAGIAVTLSSSSAPVPAVLLPRIRFVFMSTSPASGKSIQFVRVPEAGVPSAGVVRVGEVRVLFVSVCEPVRVTTSTQFDLTIPDPFDTIFTSIFVSHPVASNIGQFPVAALLIVNSFTAPATEVVGNFINSLLHPSFILLCVAP